jgi:putative membrane protein
MIMDSSKRVAVVTAISPRALIDIVFVGAEVLRLIRRLATLYGGRPGTLGFFRLARATVTHLAVTGGMAAGDSLVQQILGHGIAARLSARLGEGVVNGLLTARIGIAAVEVCRPLPFIAVSPPRLADVMAALRSTAEDVGG